MHSASENNRPGKPSKPPASAKAPTSTPNEPPSESSTPASPDEMPSSKPSEPLDEPEAFSAFGDPITEYWRLLQRLKHRPAGKPNP